MTDTLRVAPPWRPAPLALGLELLAAIVAGLGHGLSLAWPGNGQPQWGLQLAAAMLWVWRLDQQERPARAAWLGGVFATAWHASTFWWLYVSMHTYGGLAAPMAAAGVLALAAFLAIYVAAASAAYVRWCGQGHSIQSSWLLGRATLFAALWMGAELARAAIFTGFPWGASGYAHVDGPLAWLAPWVGVYGMGAASAWVAAFGVAWLRSLDQGRRHWAFMAPGQWMRQTLRASVGAVVVLGLMLPTVLVLAASAELTQFKGRLQVELLQGNISQDQKFVAGTGMMDALRWYGAELLRPGLHLVVAPETALPMLPQDLPHGYLERLQSHFASGKAAALIGIPLGSESAGYTNSVIGLQPGSAPPFRYDKHHLVPFGEFVPGMFRWFTNLMHIPLGDFDRGEVNAPSFHWQGQRLGLNICYEDLFGEDLAQRMRDPALAPTLFVNVSNLAWFNDSLAMDQHLQIARLRALEFQRAFVRATNTGATVVIDHVGRITHALPRQTRGVLHADVEGREGVTPYAAWLARFGLWPLGLLAAAVVLAAAWRSRSLPPPKMPVWPQAPRRPSGGP